MRNFVNTMSLVAPVETLNGYNTGSSYYLFTIFS